MARVLITDGEQRAALAAVRSLGRAGHEVYVCSADGRSLAGASRHVRGERQVADPLTWPAEFVRDVGQEVAARGIQVLLPITEAALLALLPERAALGVIMPFPEFRVFESVCDKAAVLDAAVRVGIAVPRERRLPTPSSASPFDPQELRFPLVVKSARSVSRDEARAVKTTVAYAHDTAALRRLLERTPAAAYPLLLQERITGPGIGVFLLIRGGAPVAVFGHRRLREKPPAGGVSVLCESAAVPQELLEKCTALLRALEWDGVAMVEFKVDEGSGVPYLMEINGRLWGSLQLAVDAGVDFPVLLVATALGQSFEPVSTYEVGTRSRWLAGDFDHLIMRLRHSRRRLALNAQSHGRARALFAFLAAFRPQTRDQVFRWSDPRPSVREFTSWVRAAARNGAE